MSRIIVTAKSDRLFAYRSGRDGVDAALAAEPDSGFDTLIADYTNLSYNGGGVIVNPSGGNQFVFHNDIESFNIKGTKFIDNLVGGVNNDTLDGGLGDDSLDGGAGADQLLAIYGSDTVKGDNGDDVIYAVAGIDGATKQLYGGDGADRYILDVRGQVTLGFDFNTTTLANFVNAITLPENTGTDWQQLGTDIAFDAAGALLGAIPVVGSALSFLTDVASTGYGAYQDAEALQQSITNQVNKANEAAKAYSNADWGTIKVSDPRDVIVINDFKVGIDSILLPSLHDANNPGNSRFYQIDDAFGDGKQGVYISILQQNSLEPLQKVVFIANNYRAPFSQSGAYELDHTAFLDLIGDLLVGSQIGKFNTTPQYGDNNASNENLSGSFANDVIHAMGGNDEVFGYYGDDVLFGDAGDDTLYGGSNQNSAWLKYEQTTSNLNAPYLNDGNDFISGGEGNDILYGESGDDFIDGDGYKIQDIAGQKVRVAIGNGNDTLYGGTGYDTLQGGAGDDLLVDIDAKVSGGDGVDTVIADYSQMNYKGFGISLDSNSGSTITERDNDGVLLQFDGIEKLIITGTNNIDYLFGGASLDILNGGGGNDLLQGGLGNDALNGGIGGDDMEGGEGNDSYTVDSISDTVNEVSGGGTDFVKASVDFTLGDFLENLTLTGLALNGIGNGLNNVLKGNDNANILTGLLGSDTLNGNAGNDSLLGGNGYDILNGGLGKDSLNGGAGRDKFVFNTKLAAGNIDTIIGYKVADDAIVLENAIFKKFTGQNSVNAANFVANATGVAKDANDYLIYNTTNGKLFYDADGNGGGLAIEFADLDIVGSYFPALNAAEFAIV